MPGKYACSFAEFIGPAEYRGCNKVTNLIEKNHGSTTRLVVLTDDLQRKT